MNVVRLRADAVAPICGPVIDDGAVVVRANRIVDVGAAAELRRRFPGAAERDLGAAVLLPGFIDTHCHLEWSLTEPGPPCADGFAGWLGSIIGRRDAMTPESFLTAARFGAATALLAGSTLVLDAGPTGAGAQAANELGLRAIVHLEAFGRDTGEAATQAAAAMARKVAALDGGLVTAGVSPHAPYTVGPELWRALLAEPTLAGRPWMTHLAESDQELPAIAHHRGPLAELFAQLGWGVAQWPGSGSVVRRLEESGALKPGLVAAHCVHLEPDDPQRLVAADVHIAHCPVSNGVLDVGAHPLAASRAAGCAIGLGSDSPATCGDFNVRSVAAACAASSGADLGADQLLRMVTLDAARVAGMEDRVGSLEVGKLADLVAIALAPGADPVAAALDRANAVSWVMVDGVPVVEGGRLTQGDLAAIATSAEAVRHD